MTVTMSALGIPGYSYADLHDPERLSSLYERFCEQVNADDPALWREWDPIAEIPTQRGRRLLFLISLSRWRRT
jgi:hypothetical protein